MQAPSDVDVYIWETSLTLGRLSVAGHVMFSTPCGGYAYTSQFPHRPGESSKAEGSNTYLTFQETMLVEKVPPLVIYAVRLPNRLEFIHESLRQVRRIPRWGAFPAEGSRTHTHCARAASESLKAGGLPINSEFYKADDGGQILPASLNRILARMMGVAERNRKSVLRGGEPVPWSVKLRRGCPPPVVPLDRKS
jgi:hypothetical protein